MRYAGCFWIFRCKSMTFDEILGQDKIKQNLIRAIKNKKFSHAYILNGESGMGKTDIAEAFAAALLCESGTGEACGQCATCKKIFHHNHPDVITLEPETEHGKLRPIKVDEVRERIVGDVMIRPYESEYKIYIVKSAEFLNADSQNAILKTIEEPPDYAVILLLCGNIDGMIQTIRSRCVTLNLTPLPRSVIEEKLRAEYALDGERAHIIAAYAVGNLGKARKMAEDEDFSELSADTIEIAKSIPEYNDAEVIAEANRVVSDYNGRLPDVLDLLEVWYRDVLLYKTTGGSDGLMLSDLSYNIRQQALSAPFGGLGDISDAIGVAKRRIAGNVSKQSAMEQLFFTIRDNTAS